MKKVLLGLILLMSSTVASAATEQLGWRTITVILTYKTHGGVLYQTDYMSANGCPSGGYYILPKTHPYYEENVELMNVARALNRKVHLSIEGVSSSTPRLETCISK